MNLWYKKGLIFVVAGISYLIGQYFRGVWFLGSTIPNVCGHAESGGVPFCNSPYLDTLGWPLIILGQVLAVVALIMLFANARAWHTWLKFSYWFIPITALIVIFVFPIPMQLGSELPRFGAITVFGELYAIITFLIVLIQFIRQYRSKK